MADLSSEQLLGLARVARLSIPDQDVEHLTMRFNALLEALDVLDEHPLEEIPTLPSLAHFRAAYAYEQETPWHRMRPPVGQ